MLGVVHFLRSFFKVRATARDPREGSSGCSPHPARGGEPAAPAAAPQASAGSVPEGKYRAFYSVAPSNNLIMQHVNVYKDCLRTLVVATGYRDYYLGCRATDAYAQLAEKEKSYQDPFSFLSLLAERGSRPQVLEHLLVKRPGQCGQGSACTCLSCCGSSLHRMYITVGQLVKAVAPGSQVPLWAAIISSGPLSSGASLNKGEPEVRPSALMALMSALLNFQDVEVQGGTMEATSHSAGALCSFSSALMAVATVLCTCQGVFTSHFTCPHSYMTQKTPEARAHLSGEGETEDNQLPRLPTEAEEQNWSQETDGDDFETLSHQSETRSDTKTDPFESASDTESLTGSACLSPTGPSIDTEASWKCPDAPTTRPPQDQPLTSVLGLDAKELDLSSDLKEKLGKNESLSLADITSGGEESLWDCVTSLDKLPLLSACTSQDVTGTRSPQWAQRVTDQDFRELRAVTLQKSRSESCLGIPGVWPCLLQCPEPGWSWPHIRNRTGVAAPPHTGPLDTTAPLQAPTEKGGTLPPTGDTDLCWTQPCLDEHCCPLSGTPCLSQVKCHHCTPENTVDSGRAPPRPHCGKIRALARAHSITEFPFVYPEDQVGLNLRKPGVQRKEKTATGKSPRTQTTLFRAPTHQPCALLDSHRGVPNLQGQYQPSECSLEKDFQDTPSVALPQENQLEQGYTSCPATSGLISELVQQGGWEEVPGPAEHKLGHSSESRPEEPQGSGLAPGPADAGDKENHLQDIFVQAENQTSHPTSRCVLREDRKRLPSANSPHLCIPSGAQVWDRGMVGGWVGSETSDAPETTLKSREKEAEAGMVLDLTCSERAWQGLSRRPAAAVAHLGPGPEAEDQGPGDVSQPSSPSLQPTPRASSASRSSCVLLVEQEGLQAPGTGCPPPEPQLTHLAEGATSCALPCGARCGLREAGGAQVPGVELEEMLSTEDEGTRTQPEAFLTLESLGPPSPESTGWEQGLKTPEAVEDRGAGTKGRPEGCVSAGAVRDPCALALAGTNTHPLPAPLRRRPKTGLEPRKRLTFLKVTSLRKGRPLASSPGAGPPQDWTTEGPSSPAPSPAATPGGAPGLLDPEHGGMAGDPGSKRLSSENCNAKRLKTTENRFRARLALAQKTFSNFFEPKVLEKEKLEELSPGSPKGEMEKSGQHLSPWRALLKSRDSEGPQGLSATTPPFPGPEVSRALGSPSPVASSGSEEWAQDPESCDCTDRWTPPRSRASLAPSKLVFPEHRRKSEPAIKCTSRQGGGRYLPSRTFPEQCWLMPSPGAQQPGISCTLPCGSACCLAYENQVMPCRPLSPKPRSPRLCSQQTDFGYQGRTSAVSMVSLGSYSEVHNCSQASERPRTPKSRASLLLSLQTLNQEDPREEDRSRGQRQARLSPAPSLRDLPRSEVSDRLTAHTLLLLKERRGKYSQSLVPWGGPPGHRSSCLRGQKACHTEPAQRLFSTTFAEHVPREAASQPRQFSQLLQASVDDLWLEKMQRRKLETQAQAGGKIHTKTAHVDRVQVAAMSSLCPMLALAMRGPRIAAHKVTYWVIRITGVRNCLIAANFCNLTILLLASVVFSPFMISFSSVDMFIMDA
ncbi:uncharacterized protein LOC122112343 [Dipodomys spectabilis]|uniref:uncharacterized protein LOC122112343 n=1 Tax=Dipodomys spectabilis TaxID=105255 RepID=UPI001C541F8F|nr:uncharacterized protein LOC122112343 [Dipodomys spectabilis]